MPDITAVFAMADVLAIGAMRAIHDRGLRVPEDISVIGFDGIDIGNYTVYYKIEASGYTTISGNRQIKILQNTTRKYKIFWNLNYYFKFHILKVWILVLYKKMLK